MQKGEKLYCNDFVSRWDHSGFRCPAISHVAALLIHRLEGRRTVQLPLHLPRCE